MIEVAEAKRALLEQAQRLDEIEVDLPDALGRVLAEEVRADRDIPSTDRSTMDGFAVRAADLSEPGRVLRLAGEIRAGQGVGGVHVDSGSAVRILTGAVVPPGADCVVMVELAQEDRAAGTVVFRERPDPGQHIRRRGEDVHAGEPILVPGTTLRPAEIAALTTVGKVRVRVVRPPIVHVLSTGDEVVAPDRAPADHQVRNSNAHALLAQLREIGIDGRHLGICPDDRDRLATEVERGLRGDVLLVTGGVSVGEHDHVREVLTGVGMDLLFHGVAVRPGKPILAGRRGSCLVVGLPGNPVSTFTGFAVFVAPALRRMMGLRHWDPPEVPALLSAPLKRRPGRTTYHLARIECQGGDYLASPVRTMGSADVVSLCRANAFIVTPGANQALEAGTRVSAIPWAGLEGTFRFFPQ